MVLLELEEFELKTEKMILKNKTNVSDDLIDLKVDQKYKKIYSQKLNQNRK